MTECICNWNVCSLFVYNFKRQVWEGSDYESLYPWTNANHMFLVDTYKWLLVSFQCKFLSIQEVVELFHSPDSSQCFSFQILVILLSLGECPGSITYNFSLLDQTCSESFLGSIHLQDCLSIDIKVEKCLHIGNFHLQLIEVFKMHFPWPVVCGLMCECTEGAVRCALSVEYLLR